MDWAEINVYTSTDGIETVTGELIALGITGFVIKDAKDFEDFLNDKTGNWDYIDDDLMGLRDCETTVTFYLQQDAAGAELLQHARDCISALKERSGDDMGRLEIEVKNVRDEDWANNWKKYFKPIEIGDKLLVKPSWEPVQPGETRRILEIDPAGSFGTGQHDTTRLCLELIERHLPEGAKTLDLGCGSGILSVGAMILGAGSVCAVDITQESVKSTKENFRKNGFSDDKLRVYCGNIVDSARLRGEIGGEYDVVCANIVADVLVAMTPYFGGFLKDGGRLIVSGIIDERCEEVLEGIEAAGFELIEQKSSNDWNAAYFQKK